ncbi:unnamed protein product [Polarella glacialis]|uniref:Cyclic nucleotide-binding domain-containing protein n=1 Tax=Polarella glacialis TaxID=89957 RepID=A0A813D163_POLGL|nr:unnamed protein product [Polarella glacialis]
MRTCLLRSRRCVSDWRLSLARCWTSCRRSRRSSPFLVPTSQIWLGHSLPELRQTGRSSSSKEILVMSSSSYTQGASLSACRRTAAALLTDVPRNASVYALGDTVQLRVLSRVRFEEFGLRQKMELEIKDADYSASLESAFKRLGSVRTVGKFAMILCTYFALSIAVFTNLEGWSWTDCVYFASITLMTVGYGDVAPKQASSRFFLVAFVLISLMVVATSVGDFLETLVALEIKNEKASRVKKMQRSKKLAGIFDQDGLRYHWRRKFAWCLLSMGALIFSGALLAKLFLQDADTWTDAVYFSVATLTTIGYGDVVPVQNGSKLAVSFFCLFGVPLFAMTLGRIVEIAYGKAKKENMDVIVGGLTAEKFDSLIEFCDQLWRDGVYNSKPQESRREEITPFEFLCFILAKNKTVSPEEIKAIMANFTELDTDHSGKFERADVVEWTRRGSINPASLARLRSSE